MFTFNTIIDKSMIISIRVDEKSAVEDIIISMHYNLLDSGFLFIVSDHMPPGASPCTVRVRIAEDELSDYLTLVGSVNRESLVSFAVRCISNI